MKSNFQDCLNRVLKDEGGYSNDPNDSGGPTNYGITLADYRKYINKNGVALDVKKMKLSDATTIYHNKYWDAMDCDGLASGVDYTVFDYAVNSGYGRPSKALFKFKDLSGTDLITAINNERTTFLKGLVVAQPKDQKFLRGWLARVARVDAYSKQLAGKKSTVGPIVATTTVGLGTALSQYWHDHMWYIIGGSVVAALAIGLAIHFLKKR
jgi:lysozyme family protein